MLINQPRCSEVIGNNPEIIEEERGYNPPLGLLYLAGYLEANTHHDVRVLDSQVEEMTYDEIAASVREYGPDVVGITAMTLTMIDVLETIRVVKEADRSVKVVLGGPHVFLYPDESASLQGVDFVVLGEGERTFASLLEGIGDEERLRKVPGLAFRAGGRIARTAPPELIDDLDSIPFPARHLVPCGKYSSVLAVRNPVTTMITSRGCPFGCTFCGRPHLGKRFRARSPRNVVDEMEECTRTGIHEFLVYDDTFTVGRDRVTAICDEIIRRRLDVGFDVRARIDTVDDEMVRKLGRAGCRGIHYGVEAGTDRILKVLNKGITVRRVEEVFAMTRRIGVPTLAYFMIGNPTETLDEIRTTFEVMRRLEADYVHLTVMTPFPGTRVYADALERGVIERDVWREFASEPTPDFSPPHWSEFFTREELDDLVVKGYRRFYLRPTYMLKRLMKLTSWTEFRKKARAGLKVLGMRPPARPRA